MTDRQGGGEKDEAEGTESLLSRESVDVLHEYGLRSPVKEVGDRIGKGRERAGEHAGDALNTAADAVEEVSDKVGRGGRRVKKHAESAVEDIGGGSERAVGVLGALGGGVRSLMRDLLGTERRAEVYVAVRSNDRATCEDVADETGFGVEIVEEVLAELEDEGVVEYSDGRYRAVAAAELVRDTPGRVGDWIDASIHDDETRRLPVEEKPELEAEYDDEAGEITVRVVDPKQADYVEILVGGEVRHVFMPVSAGDEATVSTEREKSVVARSGRTERT